MVAAFGAGVTQADEKFVGLQGDMDWIWKRALVCHNKSNYVLPRLARLLRFICHPYRDAVRKLTTSYVSIIVGLLLGEKMRFTCSTGSSA